MSYSCQKCQKKKKKWRDTGFVSEDNPSFEKSVFFTPYDPVSVCLTILQLNDPYNATFYDKFCISGSIQIHSTGDVRQIKHSLKQLYLQTTRNVTRVEEG